MREEIESVREPREGLSLEERRERQLCIIFDKLLDIESRLERFELGKRQDQAENQLKEANYMKDDIENAKRYMWEKYSEQRKTFSIK